MSKSLLCTPRQGLHIGNIMSYIYLRNFRTSSTMLQYTMHVSGCTAQYQGNTIQRRCRYFSRTRKSLLSSVSQTHKRAEPEHIEDHREVIGQVSVCHCESGVWSTYTRENTTVHKLKLKPGESRYAPDKETWSFSVHMEGEWMTRGIPLAAMGKMLLVKVCL